MYVNSQCVERVVFAVDGSCLFCYRVLFQFVARLRYAFFCRRGECHPLPRRCLYVPLCGVDLERLWWPAGGSGQPPAGEYSAVRAAVAFGRVAELSWRGGEL